MKKVWEELSSNTYPGRGIMIGKSADGGSAVIAYFIMGRSVNSRNRVFVPFEDGIKTKAFDESKLSDPSLIIYAPVRVQGGATVVTNGDQTDTIVSALTDGGSFESALRTRCFEPDEPNFTPRISGIVLPEGDDFRYKLSILKSDSGRDSACLRFFYEYEHPAAGEGRLLHTYRCDGNPIPSFEGEPTPVCFDGDLDTLTDRLWDGLNADNKVSLFVRFIDLKTGGTQTRIVNKLS